MNGVHDLGGMHGFGPVERIAHEPLFHGRWEAVVRSIVTLARERGYFNIDAFRHGIERIPPATYLRSTYFARWLASAERNLIEQGFIDADELEARVAWFGEHPDRPPPASRPMAGPPVTGVVVEVAAPPAPRFVIGDTVVARNNHPTGHTRLPRYARGKRGSIHLDHGPQTFPDANAHGLGAQPQALYSVRFNARELWGDSAEPNQMVYLDLWESYLEPAPA